MNSTKKSLGNMRTNGSVHSGKSPLPNSTRVPNLNITTDPTSTSTTIEFLLSTLMSKMGLKPNQALAFLSNSNVLLIHVIIKGMKGSYQPVIGWYEELLLHCSFMASLFESEVEGLTSALRVLDIIKTGLYSKCAEVANLAMRLLGRIATEMSDIGMSLSLIHICRCRRYAVCRSRWSPYH
eukprot:TRINITY_DN17960_c0_g1_i1.p1 TRINITY_DN17960_c0_g1~~TRINITY_DN17960_c0_g1_i1.p1  ORF type:complete len:181 (+),score=32.10 TRINITY_DN17960_c0_g1_i1:171-713(+)